MITITMTGMCQGCKISDLELRRLDGSDGSRLWFCTCIHRNACELMEARMERKAKEDNEAVLQKPVQRL